MRMSACALLVVLALAGCTPTADVADPTPTPSPAATRTARPTPTPPPTPAPALTVRPDLAELVISHQGLGPVEIGTDLAALDPAVSIFVGEHVDCGEGDVFDRWRANYPDRPLDNELRAFESGPQPSGFSYAQVYAPGPHTADGLQVGSSRSDLLAVYPGIEPKVSGAGRDRYLVTGSPASLFFDVAQPDTGWPVDTITAIGIIQSYPEGLAPSYHPPGSC